MKLHIVLREGEDGYFVASCPALKSCWSQGRTREEALNNIEEAIHLSMDSPPELADACQEVVEISL